MESVVESQEKLYTIICVYPGNALFQRAEYSYFNFSKFLDMLVNDEYAIGYSVQPYSQDGHRCRYYDMATID